MNDEQQRRPWYLLTGLVLGVILGVLYAWVLAPVQYVDTTPASLRADFKNDYRFMIAAAYASNGDLRRASARLALLEDANPAEALGAQAQQMLASNAKTDSIRILAKLAEDLQAGPTPISTPGNPTAPQTFSAVSTESPTPEASATVSPTATETNLPIETPVALQTADATALAILTPATGLPPSTPRPTRTPTPTPGLPFVLSSQSTFCNPATPGLLQVDITNADGEPAAGVEIVITWNGGQESFFTGLKPELGYGYADFLMSAGTEYTVSLSNGATRVTGIISSACNGNEASTYAGGIRLEFKQP